jgi:triphosphoribosyl-dephospho-CoA synthase
MRDRIDAKANSKWAMLACLLEATARKPGNVHPAASFADLTYDDFVQSAQVIGPSFEQRTEWSVGRIVLDAVDRTQRAVGRNTNLGILLLLAPLACVPDGVALGDGIGDVLAGLTREDAALVYEAIRLANPGGLGRVEQEDVGSAPSVTLPEAMRLAADRDSIAAQYANNFATVLAGAARLAAGGRFPDCWEEAVIELHLSLMAEFPDTLIARKCGLETARESSRRARAVLAAGWPSGETARWPSGEAAAKQMAELDAWLRADGNRRNPGTTADLVAGCLFAALRDHLIEPPLLDVEGRVIREN